MISLKWNSVNDPLQDSGFLPGVEYLPRRMAVENMTG